MKINYYLYIYIILNIFSTYTIYNFFSIFFEKKTINKKIEFMSYSMYFVLITFIYFLIPLPIFMMFSNIILFFCLSLNYKALIKKRIFSVIFIYFTLMCIEEIVVVLSANVTLSIHGKSQYASVWGIICVKLISYMIVMIIKYYKRSKQNAIIPSTYWIALCVIPTASLYLILMLLQVNNFNMYFILLGIALLFLINFVVFYLYDTISLMMEERMEKRLLLMQNKYYDKQIKLMQTSLKPSRTIQHDLKNHLLAIDILVRSDQKKQVLDHIESMLAKCRDKIELAHSGNIVVDSILNFKLIEAKENHTKCSLEINIPEKLKIASFDLAIILGNILDNAIEATKDSLEEGFIDIKIKFVKGRIFLHVENSFNSKISGLDNYITTTNKDKDNHGLGLESVRNALENYSGTLDIKTIGNKFIISIIMFVRME